MKTKELTGAALDWAVAEAEYLRLYLAKEYLKPWVWEGHRLGLHLTPYSSDHSWAGEIIDREEISIEREYHTKDKWAAWAPAPIRDDSKAFGYGPTRLIAAMRCYVQSKLGDEVEIPKELL